MSTSSSKASSGKIKSRKGWTINTREIIRGLDAAQKQRLIDSLCAVINPQRQVLLQQVLQQRTRYLTVVLEDIYQAQNASAVVRTAECLGLQEVHVVENSHPYQVNPAVVQGASKWMEISRYGAAGENNIGNCLGGLKQRGYQIIAMTLRDDSQPLDELELQQPAALCFGSEEPGLSETAHQLADAFVRIPMSGFTQSFNLSVSAGISLYYLAGKLRSSKQDWHLSDVDSTELYIEWLSRSTPTGRVLLENFINGGTA